MAFRILCAFAPLGVLAVFTPQGERAPECVIQVPETAVVKSTDVGIALHHDNGTVEHYETPAHCHTDSVALRMAHKGQPNQWIDEAGYTYNTGFSKMTGYNNIPDAPAREPGQVFYFLGMENIRGGGPVNILQPVLSYSGGEWTANSWACCPRNITTTGPSIGPAKEGDRMYGSMIRTDDSTWSIVTQFNGQTSPLRAQVGPYTYTWAVATMEDYGVSSCSQLPTKPVKFDTIELYDPQGSIVHPSWKPSGQTMCNGRTTIVDENTVTIQHGSSPSPPTPPSPPSPPGDCKCAGVTNPSGEGGSDCKSLYDGEPYCYVKTGTCADGQSSGQMPDYDWSHTACGAQLGLSMMSVPISV